MSNLPEIKYAKSDGMSIAYSRWGKGDHVVVFTPPFISNIELMWDLEEWERALTWAGKHSQMILIDKRGVGLSDRVLVPSTLEQNVGDVLAVMAAENLESVNIVGQSEGGVIGGALAALHPNCVQKLCLVGVPALGFDRDFVASFLKDGERLSSEKEEREFWAKLIETYGKSNSLWLERFAPSVAADPRVVNWWHRFERQSSSPGAVAAMLKGMFRFNVRPYMEKVRAPTMVFHTVGDKVAPVAGGRAIAACIPGAKTAEWDNPDHMWAFAHNWRESQNDIIEFVTGQRPGTGTSKRFATVLFTDIVNSTKIAAGIGNVEWGKLMELHNAICQARISDHGGSIVKNTGDGILAIFQEPVAAVSAGLDLSRDLAASGVPIRAGIHIGQIEVADDGDISGVAVNIAARVQGLAKRGEVMVSQTIRDMLMGTPVVMTDRGEHQLKGVEGIWHCYAATT